MQKKDTTPRKKSASNEQPARAELRKKLARDLAAVLANPECPTMLYDQVAEGITEMSSRLGDAYWHQPEQIERDINAYIASEEKRQGGAS